MNSHIIPTYVRQPISFVRGEGLYLYTKDGTAYLALIGRKRRRLCCVKPWHGASIFLPIRVLKPMNAS
ncbi:hypothetical protein [Moraxella catarrhalis]|uniref:hypothetical protein n=1 Tax=Moraxella catarrhalis TaxID=480 RepID=UPI00222883DD|nr:hypothetical protein [Moraxella catarrhalis]